MWQIVVDITFSLSLWTCFKGGVNGCDRLSI